MHSNVRRAVGFAVIGLLALAGPILGTAAAAPFALIALVAIVVSDGPLFDLFARPGDYQVGRLRGLFGFALSAAVLAVIASYGSLPMSAFASAVLIVVLGNVGAEVVRARTASAPILGDLTGGLVGGILGQGVVTVAAGSPFVYAEVATLVLTGALLGALIRSMLFLRDEPPVMFSVAFLLWLLVAIDIDATMVSIAVAVSVAGGVGLLAFLLDAASIEGMIAGILLGVLTIVLGGYGWFALLLAFFAIGGGSSKFRYERKLDRGVAEANGGARGGENVLANAGAAMGGLVLFSLVDAGLLDGDPLVYQFLFAGALATALSDTLASEIGGPYGRTRLITTFEPVPPGTDGGVTWQGLLAGIAGAGIIAILLLRLFAGVEPAGAAIVALAGVLGMTIDSLLGATLEGRILGNGSVNFAATLFGGLLAAGGAVLAGIAVLPPG